MVSTFPLAFLYHLFSTLGKHDGSPCDDDRFLDSNGSFLLYFGANHCRQGASCLWYEDGSEFLTKPIFYLMIPLALLMIGISAFAPTVGAFDEDLVVSGLNQADSKMQVTRTQVDNATATDYNVSNGVTMIGDSVNLRAQDYLTKAIPGIRSMQW